MIWHAEKPEQIRKALNTDFENGLSSQAAAEKLQQVGENKLREAAPRTMFQRFIDQLKDPMVLILMAAALVSILISVYHTVTGSGDPEWVEPVVILLIVVLNAVLGVIQESKAEAALEALKNMSAPCARVIRDGVRQSIPASQLVPGDVIELEAGDIVPADCRLLETYSLKSEEAALTGESVPVEKDANAEVAAIAPLGDRLNMVYAGCAISYGRGKAVVVETGMNTETGKIATMLENEDADVTPLQKKLAQMGKYLGFLCLGICAFIFLVGWLEGMPVLEMFMASVSLAVAAIPEGLPAIVTIVLAIGVQRMVAKHAIIRRLPAVETLGSASVICSDKTGTLTQNRMTLVKAFAGKTVDLNHEQLPESVRSLIQLATLCTDGTVQVENGVEKHIGDPTETAIVAFAKKLGLEKEDLQSDFPRVGEIPFDSDRKLMTTINLIGDRKVVIVKGAPDVLFSRCTSGHMEAAEQANAEMAREALRVLAVAYKYIDEVPAECRPEELENDLTFAGLIGMIDPPRPEAIEAIKECQSAGIRIVMITGDHVVTAAAIARQLGILTDDSQAITGTRLAEMSDEEFARNIRQYSVYARVTPSDKIRIVKAWQQAGEIVAMTGDGVNDAPALKAADIGCAMGITGTEVAKGAADMVLTDDNFATIVTAVKEGRGIYDNIRKAVQFLLSCNLGEILTMFVAILLWQEAPLMAIHLLFVNLVTDSLPALALGMEPAEYDIMRHKPRPKNESVFARGLGLNAIWQGLLIGALTLIAYYKGSRGFGPLNLPLGETMALGTLAISQLVHAFNVRSYHSLFKVGLTSNKYMIGAFFVSLTMMVLVLTVPFLQSIFKVIPMNAVQWLWVAGLSLVPLVVSEVVKGLTSLIKRIKGDA